MREIFVTELAKEILGPRNGMREIMRESPLNEYITGVLAPSLREIIRDIDAESEIPHEEAEIYEEENGDVDVHVPPLLSPVLDPKSRPSSMGVSFMVEARVTPIIEVCLTWARYRMVESEYNIAWEREPRYFIATINLNGDQVFWIDSDGRQTTQNRAEISLHVMITPRGRNCWLVNLYLVNRITLTEGQNPIAEHHIFQPQIRVISREGTHIVPGIEKMPGREEEKELAFLYRNRPVLARGFLCSAVWKDIDPENNFDGNLDFSECLDEPPFMWIDGNLLPSEERNKFSPPDIRTEFVPVYSIPSPKLDWPQEYGKSPELRAEVLAESWDPDDLQRKLSPLISGYEQWIKQLNQQISQFSDSEYQMAVHQLQRCREIRNRIRHGINLLVEDENARLAFCFANKAMDLQARWTRKQSLEWKPFQLAFILMTLDSVAKGDSVYRDVCDLLWVPTGAGKTEAYLAIAIFTMAYRRRRALRRNTGDRTGAGVSVLTRYTLRLLTIQQFRRTLAVITASEYLRVYNLTEYRLDYNPEIPVGWQPAGCPFTDNFIWGSTPFSVGLWVGGGVTPNKCLDTWDGRQNIPGALNLLKGQQGEGEPAQVLNCPACKEILAIPEMGLRPGTYTLHIVVHTKNPQHFKNAVRGLPGIYGNIQISSADFTSHRMPGYFTLTLIITAGNTVRATDIDALWDALHGRLKVNLVPVRASRPGYFIRWYLGTGRRKIEYDFDIFCPNPDCPLHRTWCGGAPAGSIQGESPHPDSPEFDDGNKFSYVQEAFRNSPSHPFFSERIPILAYTVDDQIYHHIPSMVVATVDKFARPPFEPRASSLFGNVDYHHCIWGYYRQYQHPSNDLDGHPGPAGTQYKRNFIQINHPDPPDLILQDELHLIEGPLGSLVGIYETAIDFLCSEEREWHVKYIASTATIRRAEEQVQAVFARKLQIFPPPGLTANDRFFMRDFEAHPLDDTCPGRLYMGICAPGRGPLTPLYRMWARLLQTAWNNRNHPEIDAFWTLTGYFNAVRELGGARALYRQDIPQRLNTIGGANPRPLSDNRATELSSRRTDSTNLPAILELLNRGYPDAQDALFTTSMFGTGVDIPRIGLMVVSGQPKTTSAYIQSTGRVGRSRGALVITFLRASRPRDLNHYEFFSGYHRQLNRFVEPITVYPFAPGVLERACGPVAVFILRNMRDTSVPWHRDTSATQMAFQRTSASEVQNISYIMERRGQHQPGARRPVAENVRQYTDSKLDDWQRVAHRNLEDLKYVEYAIVFPPQHPVVLGDSQHQYSGLDVAYENVPQSLRDIEETTGFQTGGE